jgi:hypothetical protein
LESIQKQIEIQEERMMASNYTDEEVKEWGEIKLFFDAYLKRDVKAEKVTVTVKEVLTSLVEDLFFMTRNANCNCINHDRYEELNKDAEKLAQLAKLLGKDMSGYLKC